jgi:FkbM family methyltransferase
MDNKNSINMIGNGELRFLNKIEKEISVIFDVGSRVDSLFAEVACEVHYFDPNPEFLDKLSQQPTKNTKSFFNSFGLSDTNSTLEYFPAYQSFVDRTETFRKLGSSHRRRISEHTKLFELRTAKDYITKNKVEKIDFLKIDTEGFEFNVLKGFGDKLSIVKYIQFEYGGCFPDAGITLTEVIDYLKSHNFENFSCLHKGGEKPIGNIKDLACKTTNIVCCNKNF